MRSSSSIAFGRLGWPCWRSQRVSPLRKRTRRRNIITAPPPEAARCLQVLSSGQECSSPRPHGAMTGTCWPRREASGVPAQAPRVRRLRVRANPPKQ